MSARFVGLGLALSAALLVTGCGSTGAFIGDNLPTWAGGLPPGAPPRAGAPGYDAYLKSIGENDPANANAQPAAANTQPAPPPSPPPPPRKSAEAVDQPIH